MAIGTEKLWDSFSDNSSEKFLHFFNWDSDIGAIVQHKNLLLTNNWTNWTMSWIIDNLKQCILF
jgi:hypothetical protein